MGDFVGKPITPELLQGALQAHGGMLSLIERWHHRGGKGGASIADGALDFWEHHKVFSTRSEYCSLICSATPFFRLLTF